MSCRVWSCRIVSRRYIFYLTTPTEKMSLKCVFAFLYFDVVNTGNSEDIQELAGRGGKMKCLIMHRATGPFRPPSPTFNVGIRVPRLDLFLACWLALCPFASTLNMGEAGARPVALYTIKHFTLPPRLAISENAN